MINQSKNLLNKFRVFIRLLYILPIILLFLIIIFLGTPNINTASFSPFILPSIAAGVSLVIGLSTRNANISERARVKAAELLKYLNENESDNENKSDRKECLYNQMILFDDRFHLNQIALFLAWISLFIGFFIGSYLSYGQEMNWILAKLPILIIGLLSYSFLMTLIDIYLGSKTLGIELKYIENLYKQKC
jgi:Protein of unknown function (DUF2721)